MDTYFTASVPRKLAPHPPSAKVRAHERVVADKQALESKYRALCEFLDDPNCFSLVDSIESGLMYEQRNAMKFYLEALTARVKLGEDK